MAETVNEKMMSLINKAILYQYATEVVLIILCLVLSVFAVIDIRKIKQIYLYLKVKFSFFNLNTTVFENTKYHHFWKIYNKSGNYS